MRLPIALCLTLSTSFVFAQGLTLLSNTELADYPEHDVQSLGYASDVPTAFSMERFAPPALAQKGGTCVGFSAGYCAMSTMWNRATNTTSPIHKHILCFDPYYNFSILSSGCDQGLTFPRMFESLASVGNMRDLMPPTLSCDFQWLNSQGEVDPELLDYVNAAWPFRIEDYGTIDLNKSNWLDIMRQTLANQIPVVIGSSVGDDFTNSSYGGNIDADGNYIYRSSEVSNPGGHAMCVLGYDDFRNSGSFLVRNSWGYGFGDKGNVWIRYADFKSLVSEAWVIIPQDWMENIHRPDDYTMKFQDTADEELFYGRVKGNSATYEGFYAEGVNVLGYELYNDGGASFGRYTNMVKDGKGIYWNANGEKFYYTARNGEIVETRAGYSMGTNQDATDLFIDEVANRGDGSSPFLDSFEDQQFVFPSQD